MAIRAGTLIKNGRIVGGGGGGGGFSLGPPTNIFNTNALRNTYTADTANADWLAAYDENPSFLVQTGTTNIRFYRRRNDAWSEVTNIIKGPKGDSPTSGEIDSVIATRTTIPHYVLPANVEQVGNAITLTIANVTAYGAGGLTVEFTAKDDNSDATTLQINALGEKRLLHVDEVEFESFEIHDELTIRAIYNGTDFVSDFVRRAPIHQISPSNVTGTGDAIVINDPSIRSFHNRLTLIFRAEHANTGAVTIQTNSGFQLALRRRNGDALEVGDILQGRVITASYDNSQSPVGWASDIEPPRSIKGKLLATATLAVGDHSLPLAVPWTVEAGVTEVTAEDVVSGPLGNHDPAIADAILALPYTEKINTAQIGWLFEVHDGTNIVGTLLNLFGISSQTGVYFVTSNGAMGLRVTFYDPNSFADSNDVDINKESFVVTVGAIPTGSTLTLTDEHTLRVYVLEN